MRPKAECHNSRPDDQQIRRLARGRAGRCARRRHRDDSRLRQRRHALGADRCAHRAGRARAHHRQQQRRQRRHRPRRADRGEARAQDPVLVPAPGRLVALRQGVPRGRARARAGAAGHARRAHPRRGRRHRRILHADRVRHQARRRQGDAAHRRARLRARVPDPRRLRADQGRPRRPLGQPHLPHERAQLRPDHGGGGENLVVQVRETVELGELDPGAHRHPRNLRQTSGR